MLEAWIKKSGIACLLDYGDGTDDMVERAVFIRELNGLKAYKRPKEYKQKPKAGGGGIKCVPCVIEQIRAYQRDVKNGTRESYLKRPETEPDDLNGLILYSRWDNVINYLRDTHGFKSDAECFINIVPKTGTKEAEMAVLSSLFGVSCRNVYRWAERGYIKARQAKRWETNAGFFDVVGFAYYDLSYILGVLKSLKSGNNI